MSLSWIWISCLKIHINFCWISQKNISKFLNKFCIGFSPESQSWSQIGHTLQTRRIDKELRIPRKSRRICLKSFNIFLKFLNSSERVNKCLAKEMRSQANNDLTRSARVSVTHTRLSYSHCRSMAENGTNHLTQDLPPLETPNSSANYII